MNEAYPILLAEDCADDVFLMERALQRAQLRHPLRVVTDGQKAIEYLNGQDDYADRDAFPFPGLVILDLKMPGVTGFQVIEWVRKNSETKLIPIVILSSSSASADINRAYELGANAYLIKPAEHRSLERLLGTIGDFWFSTEGPVRGWSATAQTVSLR